MATDFDAADFSSSGVLRGKHCPWYFTANIFISNLAKFMELLL